MSYTHRPFAFLLVLTLICSSIVVNEARAPFACDPTNGSTRNMLFCQATRPIQVRVRDLIGRLTLQEKIGLLVNNAFAVPRLGIQKYEWWSEALHGVAISPGVKFGGNFPGATSFPQVITTAASFNASLWQAIGEVVSHEARAMYNGGVGGLTYWSPNVNILRDPRWGRSQETPGEDPLITGRYAARYVRGLQSMVGNRLKVAACCKHYTAYDLDHWNGNDRFSFNAKVSPQDLEDTFNVPFKTCIEEGEVASVMCSYNQVNGKPTCADPDLLRNTVRGQWRLSLNLDCGPYLAVYTEGAIRMGKLSEDDVNLALTYTLTVQMRLGMFDGPSQPYANLGPRDVCTPAHKELALEVARQGIVLLLNRRSSAPLSTSRHRTVAVIGPNSDATETMIGNYAGVPCGYTSPLEGIGRYARTIHQPGCSDVACSGNRMFGAAIAAAQQADATVLVMGLDQSMEREGFDRSSLLLPGLQQQLVSSVARASRGPTVLVLMSGGPLDVSFAKNDPRISAIIWAGYPGQAGGAAIADVLFGRTNPGGKLPMTWYPENYLNKAPMTTMALRPDQANGYPGRTYRFYKGPVVFPFGHGLSYTTYTQTIAQAPSELLVPLTTLNAMKNSTTSTNAIRVSHTNCDTLSLGVHVDVKNTGPCDGSHTVFMYTTPPASKGAPAKQLIGFEKVHVPTGSQKRVKIDINVCNHLSVVDEYGIRRIPMGEHSLHIGDDVVSDEARAMHNGGAAGLTFWSPNVNILRDPRWGRSQETPGEDPLTSSKYAVSYVRGLQGAVSNRLKVAACCKHFTAYDLDLWNGIDRFIFNANVASVMCSYNQVNGKPTCADPDLLKNKIRAQWKLNGYIVSDCDSVKVLHQNQHYTKTPEEAVALAIKAG
ncbi:Glycoside hydrolase, family 3, N-terminal [Dillenia turbinata]|uniref:Glycoside hydrolase, family 3, N-terminal n=1 Tax=Dillenia turbinata TaxID=194707 RepID=A0AAN8VHW9_9MAGN